MAANVSRLLSLRQQIKRKGRAGWRALRIPRLPIRRRWNCNLGNGKFEHDWEVIHDWEGDPGVIGGTQDICFLRCRACGEEDYDIDPMDFLAEPDPDLDREW